jgi:hypothetical protein
MLKFLLCKLFHKKYWIGTPGYFWVNGENTLYCNCNKCGGYFEKNIQEKNWERIQKEIRIDMKT